MELSRKEFMRLELLKSLIAYRAAVGPPGVLFDLPATAVRLADEILEGPRSAATAIL